MIFYNRLNLSKMIHCHGGIAEKISTIVVHVEQSASPWEVPSNAKGARKEDVFAVYMNNFSRQALIDISFTQCIRIMFYLNFVRGLGA